MSFLSKLFTRSRDINTAYPEFDKTISRHGKFRSKRLYLIGGQMHTYKTFLLIELAMSVVINKLPWLVRFANLVLRKPKPVVLVISFDAPAHVLLSIAGTIANNIPSITEPLDVCKPEELARIIHGAVNRTGYHLELLYVNPAEATPDMFVELIEHKLKGRDLAALFIDNIDLLKKRNDASMNKVLNTVEDLARKYDAPCIASLVYDERIRSSDTYRHRINSVIRLERTKVSAPEYLLGQKTVSRLIISNPFRPMGTRYDNPTYAVLLNRHGLDFNNISVLD